MEESKLQVLGPFQATQTEQLEMPTISVDGKRSSVIAANQSLAISEEYSPLKTNQAGEAHGGVEGAGIFRHKSLLMQGSPKEIDNVFSPLRDEAHWYQLDPLNGEQAAMWWAQKYLDQENGLLEKAVYGAGGLAASLYTPETYGKTSFVLAIAVLLNAGVQSGMEIRFGKNFRVAPFGNRTGHPTGELPHYHRRVPDPTKPGQSVEGQGIGRHRPWDTKSSDRSFRDRF